MHRLTRMSILCSTIRMIPYFMLLRWAAYATAALFLASYISILILETYVCEHNPAWKRLYNTQCERGRSVAVLELIGEYQLLMRSYLVD